MNGVSDQVTGIAFVGRIIAACSVVLVNASIGIMIACNASSSANRDATALSTELSGLWITDVYESQLGQSTTELCLRRDGTYGFVFKSEGTTLTDGGRYDIHGDTLTLVGNTSRITYQISAASRYELRLREQGRSTKVYKKVRESC